MFAHITKTFTKIPALVLGLIAALLLFTAVAPAELSLVSSTQAAVSDALGINNDIKHNASNDEVSIQKSIVNIINQFLLLLGVFLLGIIIYAGILIISSDGEEEGLTKGRKMIIYAVIGVIVIFLSFSIVNFIGSLGDTDASAGV